MTIEFTEVTTPPGLEIHDSIEQRHLQIETPEPVSIESPVSHTIAATAPVSPSNIDANSASARYEPASTDDPQNFYFPVNKTCTIETDELRFDQPHSVTIHDGAGRTEENFAAGERGQLDDRTQYIGLSGPIKLYCRIESPGTIDVGLTAVRVNLERTTEIELGARSLHDRPAGTITTPPDIDSMATSISVLSSALKTTSPERTWPTLRGHPPLIELGDTLEIPDSIPKSTIRDDLSGSYWETLSASETALGSMDGCVNENESRTRKGSGTTEPSGTLTNLTTPETAITITTPPTYLSLFQAAPLAFFLGATVLPTTHTNSPPTLHTPQFEYSLPTGEEFGDEIAALLKRFFFLDCLTRTEGIFQYDLLERSFLEGDLPFDLVSAYEKPLPERLELYLEPPTELIEEYSPRWPLTAHIPPEPESVELLPFIVNELGIVRPSRGRTPETVPSQPSADTRLIRSASKPDARRPSSPSSPTSSVRDASEFVVPTVTDESIEHAWFGNNVPQNASKATIEAYRNQLDRDARNDSIEILLVCNDARMLDEHDLLDATYGTREELPFEIHSEFGVDTEKLADLLTDGGYDFVHYIGHATEDGLRCPDGDLDVRTLESVDVGVFFLNACQSYHQALALTRRGAFGGVSTYSDVANDDAVTAGETMARLLNRGFPLRGALEIARQNTGLGDQYLIVGDGSADIAQSEGGAPAVVQLTNREDGTVDFALQSYSTKEYRLGTATESSLPTVADWHLSPGYTPFLSVDEGSLQEYLSWNELPVVHEKELFWNDGVGAFHFP
ncbi:hypothetical protein [Natrialba aegyptia]|uniref:CHAT domain-containing protein n=1 Tax=Natrialba aegyptia DSM 13077 TaxID=1227491 RepID=M0B1C5_9EURY|nr:hypothetical protein [Natrialba aegyptia]ELZ04560.1 hypothetical protein C480_13636 [Natrialba aegyptia DSM 13077]